MTFRHFGAVLQEGGACTWRVWAPLAKEVDLLLYPPISEFENDAEICTATIAMAPQVNGFFDATSFGIQTGQRYAYRLDGGSPLPDPASRWQPHGVHRPSVVWSPDLFSWTDADWGGLSLGELVIYELHVGTFTDAGTFQAIIPRLPQLKELGITAVELMPLAQFPGNFGWGYDGVYWYAVQHSYGGPSALQELVNACHAQGIAVILDVVYNHFGPEGNYIGQYAPFYTDRYKTPWGSAINYDGESSRQVRDFVLENVRYWIGHFHVDGFRLDAVHAILDKTIPHLVAEIKQVADEEGVRQGRPIHVIAESNLNDVRLLQAQTEDGYGVDAQWSDDFHHCVHSLLTGEREGYYVDFDRPALQLVKALNEVFVYNGVYSHYRGRPHGRPVGDQAGDRFVISVQTHDQVGNRAQGDRFGTLIDFPRQRLAAGLLLLAPHLPMLFMGEEYGETRPFPYFCDFQDEALAQAVRIGRREEFSWASWNNEIPDPLNETTMQQAKLSWNWERHPQQAGLRALYRELLTLRKTYPVFRDFRKRMAHLLSDKPGEEVLLLTRGNETQAQEGLWAVFNLSDQRLPIPEFTQVSLTPLLSSDESRFGGEGTQAGVEQLAPFSFVVYLPA